MALRAGVAVADVEFMQFHPTALHHPAMPRPLLSEALRGEGAVLRDEHGVAFMADEHPLGDLAPRDVVARAIARRLDDRRRRPPLARRHLDRRLRAPLPDDLARLPGRRSRPACATGCRSRRPRTTSAAGVCTDLDGATTLPGLVGLRRGRVLGRARRQPSRLELAARRPGVRAPQRSTRDRRGQGRARRDRACCAALDATDRDAGCPRLSSGRARPSTREMLQRLMTARCRRAPRRRASLERAAAKELAGMADTADPEVRNLVDRGRGARRRRHRPHGVARARTPGSTIPEPSPSCSGASSSGRTVADDLALRRRSTAGSRAR